MTTDRILDKAVRREPLTRDEAYALYECTPVQELAAAADAVRRATVADPTVVTWQIDRNVNITNVCISGCKFCNFHCKPHDTQRAFVTSREEYREKIAQTLALGGDQLLLQGGLHPQLGIDFYEELFRDLKRMFPRIRLHALGAPEVAHIARISGLTTLETLRRLMAAGLDSLPGAGAEILDPDVRRAALPFGGQVRCGVRLARLRRRDRRCGTPHARRRRPPHRDHLRPLRGASGACLHG